MIPVRHPYPLLVACLALGGAAVGVAHAEEGADATGKPPGLALGAWVRAGFGAVVPPGANTVRHGPRLSLARLSARGTIGEWGQIALQVEGASESVVLLDAVAEIAALPALSLRAGRFKTPTSADFLVGAPVTPFLTRSLLVSEGLVQQRLIGLEAVLARTTGPGATRLQVGWFLPAPADRALLADSNGAFLSARGLIALPAGLSLHAAYLDLLGASNQPVLPPEPAGAPARLAGRHGLAD